MQYLVQNDRYISIAPAPFNLRVVLLMFHRTMFRQYLQYKAWH